MVLLTRADQATQIQRVYRGWLYGRSLFSHRNHKLRNYAWSFIPPPSEYKWTPDSLGSWEEHIGGEMNEPYWKDIEVYLAGEDSEYRVCPLPSLVFAAFQECPFSRLKVVIVGQDPYPWVGQAQGLAFSLPSEYPLTSSLRNIIKEIGRSCPKAQFTGDGDLHRWAHQGVLLLNSTLTVRQGEPNSHYRQSNWTQFTDTVLRWISANTNNIVFLLWGGSAHRKSHLIDNGRHLVLKTSHPSGLSAYRGFDGCNCFADANTYLSKKGLERIDWSV